MPILNITPLPTPPTRQDPTNFSDRADSFLGALPTFVNELNTAADNIETVQADTIAASEYAWEAVDAAALAAGTTVWVMGTNYTQYDSAIDPIDFKNYRTMFAGISNSRPGIDPGRWVLLSGLGDVTTDTNQTITGQKIFTGNVEITSLNGLSPIGFSRNKVINGSMAVSQLASTFTNPANNDYTLDQWQINKLGAVTAQVAIARIDEMSATGSAYPIPILSTQYCLRATVSTAQAVLGTGDELYAITQPIEGTSLCDLGTNPFTVSFWVKSDRAGTYCIAMSGTNGYNIVREYVVNTVNTWEKKTITFEGINLSHLTWDFTANRSMTLKFILAAGASYQDPSFIGSWKGASYLASSNQVNFLQTTGHKFQVTGVQFEAGSQATPFEVNSPQYESEKLRRYLRRLPSLVAWPLTSTTLVVIPGDSILNMRAAPSGILFNDTNAVHDVGTAFRNIVSIDLFAEPYFNLTISATTTGKLHNIQPGSIYASARM